LIAYLGTGVFLHLAFERYYWFMIALAAAATGILERALLPHTEPAHPPMVQYTPRDRSVPRPLPQRG
jgi:hypothetical protein